ncbi:uncharacterized protein LY89DRAFT_740179 [Mollisia scopiformis]|uniref:Zn(2)-C6 fungal-type domain-containing protein n=1 Tax=Mollisia scopiformis TaxID=149040 RepID=A0A132BFH8_MOLSC|nr:uncharacterized protein LY89DRAFT_740179 [Mollisia scopiformis]KUJ10467.1 hypothetical protein LY89DRAFT_740179 [Mollisia scopiformis]
MDATGPATPIAAVACMHCRRLKMKCIGSDKPPCARCAKAGRECIVQKPDRTQSLGNISNGFHQEVPRPARGDFMDRRPSRGEGGTIPENSDTNNPIVWRKDGFGAAIARNFFPINELTRANKEPALPSIYNTTPYATVFSASENIQDDDSGQPNSKRRRIEATLQTPRHQNTQDLHMSPYDTSVPERDMMQLIHIFRNRMLVFIPLLQESDLEDISHVISQKRTLALCICYVTTRYVPGGERTRTQLIPAISDILQDRNVRPQTDGEKWTMLQALSVLYAYRPTIQENTTRHDQADISHRSIKSFTESYALHLSVHRSIIGLKASIRSNEPNINSTQNFKYYIYWLWLFNMSNHFSVVTGTPPSIRIDATIRAAPQILDNIDVGHGPRQILSEAELCIHWDKISAHSPALAEWWCPPDTADEASAIHPEILTNVAKASDEALTSWSRKWGPAIPTEPLGQAMDFHFRFTKFCLSTYMIRNLSIGRNLTTDQQVRIKNSVQAAHYFCEHLLDLGPVYRDAARYMGDFGFVMVSFSCLFIIEACKNYRSLLQDEHRMLGTVEEVALLMKQLAISPSSTHGPGLQASIVLYRLHELDKHDETEAALEEAPGAQYSFTSADAEGFMMDPIWDLLNFFPEIKGT